MIEKKSETKGLGALAAAGILMGGIALSACDKTTSPKEEASGIAAAKTLAEFQAECAKLGGSFAAHDCSGKNDCKGHSYLEGEGVSAHDCAGHSSCQGGSCIES
jgi:hypothetical protein